MLNNFYRILAVLIYPLLLTIAFISIFRKAEFKKIIIQNKKYILANTLVILLLFVIFIYFFFTYEKNIYSWDYAGHWVRSINLRRIFFENPSNIFNEVYKSMNYSDYSYLPALFTLPFSIISVDYKIFCIGNFIFFILPIYMILQIAYYKYFSNNKYLPIILFVLFYPLYYPIFEGKPCSCGLVFMSMCYLLIFFQDINDIDTKDVLLINLFTYISIFERRWYLYTVIVFYLSFLIKYLLSINKINNKYKFLFCKIFLSGILMFLVVIIVNRPFLLNALTSDYSTIYSTYNKGNKILGLINYYSPIIFACCIIGFYLLFKENKALFIINIFSLVVSTIMFWTVQSFETHHYYISMINMIIPFTLFIYNLFSKKLYYIILSFILFIQSILIFVDAPKLFLFTHIKRTPIIMKNRDQYYDFCTYMKNLLGEDSVAYICGSSSIFNEDIIRNSQLPDLEMPTFEYAQVDLVDGFPNNIDYIRYILIPEPFQYYDKESQHVHELLADSIKNKDEFKKIYKLIDNYELEDININIYEKQGEYTQEMKQYLFDEIIKYYPNNRDIFKEILE